jgi:hypothetical protein
MHILASLELMELANCLVCMVYDNFDNPPPSEKNFSRYAHSVTSELIFCPNHQPLGSVDALLGEIISYHT